MVAVMASEEKVRSAIEDTGSDAAVAAINGPEAVVLSGSEEAVAVVLKSLGEGVRSKRLAVSHAFHSSLMEPMVEALRTAAQGAGLGIATVPMVSNVSGGIAEEGEMSSAEYWCDHVLRPVRFMDGMRTLEALGYDRYVEVGPQGVLVRMARKCVADSRRLVWVSSMERGVSTSRVPLGP